MEDCLFYVSSKVSDDPDDTRTYPTNNSDNIATLTINGTPGEVSLVSTTNSYLGVAGPNGKIVINGGYHETAGLTAYKSIGGAITITDGKFKSTSNLTSYVLLEGSNENISVSGGSFYKWDPSNGDKESKSNLVKDERNYLYSNLDLTKEKYIVLYDKPSQGWRKVTKEYNVNESTSNPKDDFGAAIQDPDVGVIEVNRDITNNDPFQLENRGEVTINMHDNTFTVTRYSGLVLNNSQLIINDGNFEGGGIQVVYPGSKLTMNNCNINMSTGNTSQNYGIYAAASAEVILNGCTISFRKNESQKRAYFYAINYGEIHALYVVLGAPSSHKDYKDNPIITEGTGSVVIYGGEFGFDPTKWIAAGAEVTEVSSTKWTVETDGITSTKDANGKVTTIISYGTFDFDPTPWLNPTSTVIETGTQWVVTAATQEGGEDNGTDTPNEGGNS